MSENEQAASPIQAEAPAAYAFNPETGELLGRAVVDADPEEPGRWVIPYGVTLIPPPASEAGKALVLAGEAWAAIEDRRGATWYATDGTAVVVDRLGDPATFDPPLSAEAPPPSPPDLRAYAKDARDRHENGGITVSGVPVATDDRSKTLLTGARLRVEKDPTLVTSFAAADGHVYPLTAAMILAVSDAIGAFVAELFEAYAGIMVDLMAGTITTTEEIDARYGALNVAF